MKVQKCFGGWKGDMGFPMLELQTEGAQQKSRACERAMRATSRQLRWVGAGVDRRVQKARGMGTLPASRWELKWQSW